MTMLLAPDDGPFVFGAFAAHLDQSAPLRPGGLSGQAPEDGLAAATDDGLQAPLPAVTAERGLAS